MRRLRHKVVEKESRVHFFFYRLNYGLCSSARRKLKRHNAIQLINVGWNNTEMNMNSILSLDFWIIKTAFLSQLITIFFSVRYNLFLCFLEYYIILYINLHVVFACFCDTLAIHLSFSSLNCLTSLVVINHAPSFPHSALQTFCPFPTRSATTYAPRD